MKPSPSLLALLLCAPSFAAPFSLHNGQTSPSSEGWGLAGFGTYSETLAGGAAVLTTAGSPDLNRAGYSRISPINLDRDAGYIFTFDVRLASESHSTNDRAGLSILFIGDDLFGLELAFWTDEIWAQEVGFTHSATERALFDTTQRTTYTIAVQGTGYTVFTGSTPLISGSLKNYSGSGLPYSVTNFLFFGDDTTSASATSEWYGATVEEVPEPSTFLLLAAGLSLCANWQGRRHPGQRAG